MDTASLVTWILGSAGACVVTWLVATEKMRGDLYSRRFDVYQKLNEQAAEVVFASIRAGRDGSYAEAMIQSRLTLMETYGKNSLLLTQGVSDALGPLFKATMTPDVEELRDALNATVRAMSSDLRLKSVDVTTIALLPFREGAPPPNKSLERTREK